MKLKKYFSSIVLVVLVVGAVWFFGTYRLPDNSFVVQGTVTRIATIQNSYPMEDVKMVSIEGDGRMFECDLGLAACAMVKEGDAIKMRVNPYNQFFSDVVTYDVKELSINTP